MAMNFGDYNEGGSGWTSSFAGGSSSAPAPASLNAGSTTSSLSNSAGDVKPAGANWGSVLGSVGKSQGMSGMAAGASVGGVWGAVIGGVSDLITGYSDQKALKEKSEKEASNFLTVGLVNMANLKEEGDIQKGAVQAALGATGAELTSGTSQAVKNKTNRVVDFNYNMAYQDMLSEYKRIKDQPDAADQGGIFGTSIGSHGLMKGKW